jgi:hypothetical protein
VASRTEAASGVVLIGHDDPARRSERQHTWWWGALGGLAAVAAAWAICGSLGLFPLLTENGDEGAYLAQSAALRSGQIIPDAPAAHTAAFLPWFAVARDGHFVYKYSPVFPAILALGHWLLATDRAALGIGAALAVLLVVAFARELGASRRAALIGGGLFLLAPVFLVQSATFLPYVTNLALLLAFAVLLLRGIRTGKVWILVAAGCALGIAFWSRPFDALLFATPVLVWTALRSRSPLGRSRVLAFFALGLVPGLLAFLAYNALATGNPFELPFNLLDRADTIGFGQRRTLSTDSYVNFTIARAWDATEKNVLLVITWSFGNVVLVVLGIFGYLSKPRVWGRSLLAVILLAWPAGFFFFWGSYTYVLLWGGGLRLGPWYYLPMLVPLSVAAGIGLDRGLHRSVALSLVAVALCVAVAVPVVTDAVHSARISQEPREHVRDAIDAATNGRRSLVFLGPVWGPFLQNPLSFLRNAPDYGGDRLYAIENADRDLEITREHRGRVPYEVSFPNGFSTAAGAVAPVWVDHETVTTGTSLDLTVGVPVVLRNSDLGLRISAGGAAIEAAISTGTTTVRLSIDASGRLALASTGAGAASSISPRGVEPGDNLDIAIVEHVAGRAPRALVRRLAPLALKRAAVSVMWPGAVTGSLLAPDGTWRWSARRTSRAPS